MPALVEILLALAAAVTLGLYFRQRILLRSLRREREEIEGEEQRMFDFLHGLGVALQSDVTARSVNRYIVNGVVKVMAAHSGCLYLLDKSGGKLVPAFLSHGCPPFVGIPPAIAEQARSNDNAIDSFLRLYGPVASEGLLGRVLGRDAPTTCANLAQALGSESASLPAMVAPLSYAGRKIGVLAIVGKKGAPEFSANDFEVFTSIAEQSSFALGSALLHREAHEKKELEKEIRTASEIQKILLPSSSPTLDDYLVSGVNYPARIVSGDYYDYIAVDENHYGIVIGDVSGKGIPASLIMAMCRSVVRAKASGNHSPSAVLSSVNRIVFPDIREDMFVSMAYVILKKNSSEVTLVRAGHDPPLLYRRATNETELIKPPGLAVGIDEGDVFDRVTHDHSFEMEPGDRLILYTDGATEALDHNGNEYGLDPLREAIIATADRGPEAVLERIFDGVREFIGDTPQNDDLTLIAIEKR
ncbi:MAG: PP2C family protein-serine/threonine phosphatase [Verrucomicrobiales bacterium]